jgi:hypothetical protein
VSLHICLDYYYLKKCARNTTTKKRVIFTNLLFVEKLNIIEPILIYIYRYFRKKIKYGVAASFQLFFFLKKYLQK